MTPRVTIGLETFTTCPPDHLRGSRLGLLANPASVDSNFTHAKHLLDRAFPGQLTALFSPQHGFYADKQDNMVESDHGTDPELGIPVFSLYSSTRVPTQKMFDCIDTLVIDIQDVGTRVYTFIYTISFCLETAARYGKKVVILDRPNPIGGLKVEGNVLEPDYASFVGRFPIPMRHGLTVGEISWFFNREFDLGCDLEIIPMTGWHRKMLWQDTGLVWIPPSPNLPTMASCLVYPGQVIFEGTNISEGRGTTLPFVQFGAPFICSRTLEKEIKDTIQGAHLRPVIFEPTAGKWQGHPCQGFHIHVTAPDDFKPFKTALILWQAIMKHHLDAFEFKMPPYEYEYDRLPMDLILGSRDLREKISAGQDINALESAWQPALSRFKSRARAYHLYP